MSKFFTIEELSELLVMLEQNKVTEFELEIQGEKLKLKRGEAEGISYQNGPTAVQAPSVVMATPVPQQSILASQPTNVQQPQPTQAVAAASSNAKEIKSPMVGTFYRRPSPDAAAYVEVGQRVSKGDVLCIVEAMKLMNEIEAEISGKIVEVCLEDGQMVEYGEVLFRIDPSA